MPHSHSLAATTSTASTGLAGQRPHQRAAEGGSPGSAISRLPRPHSHLARRSVTSTAPSGSSGHAAHQRGRFACAYETAKTGSPAPQAHTLVPSGDSTTLRLRGGGARVDGVAHGGRPALVDARGVRHGGVTSPTALGDVSVGDSRGGDKACEGVWTGH